MSNVNMSNDKAELYEKIVC